MDRLILLTGFEPFAGRSRNPSQEAALSLDHSQSDGLLVRSVILPVDARRASQVLIQNLDKCRPAAVLSLGLATSRRVLSVERVAINLLDFRIADNRGVTIRDEPVVKGAPDAYFVTLPARSIVEAIRTAGIPAELSLSAGSFVCNQVSYIALHHLATHPELGGCPFGFIHMPALPEMVQAEPALASMTLETIVDGVRAALSVIAQVLSASTGGLSN